MKKDNLGNSIIPQSVPDPGAVRFGHFSPLRLFTIIISSIFFAEIFAMLVVYVLNPLPYYLTTLTDACIMVVLIFPILYLFSFRPLIRHITERKQAEEKLRKAYEDLEQRVQDRTEELRIANSELEEEIHVRRRAEAALQKSEQRLSRAQEIAHLGSWELDLLSDQLTWSDEVYRIFGLPPQEFGASYAAFLEAVHPDDRAAVNEAYFGSIRDFRDTYEIEHRVVKRSSGEVRTVYEKCEHFRDAAGQIVRSVGMVHDITERKKAEVRLQQLNRTLQAMSASNQAMMRAKGETELLDEVCKIIVQDCGYAMVWIGYAEHDDEKRVRPVASAGFEEGYLETLQITWGDTERGQGPTGTAIRTGKRQGCRNMLTDPKFALWREQAEKRGYNSSLVLPLMTKGQAFGSITIYSREPDAFSADEEELLTELASDLANGIETIRLREIRALIEAQLRLARDELEIRVEQRTAELATANRKLSDEISERKEIERQLRIQTAAMESAANGILITDPGGCILWTNPAITRISGYADLDLVGQSTRIFNSGVQDTAFYQDMWETILSGQVWRGEITNRRKDGTAYVEEQTITPVWNEDAQISHFIAIKQDITERKLIYAQLEDSNRELRMITASERRQRFLAEGLAESSLVLNMSLELHAVLDHIFEQTRRTIPYLMADIVLIEDGVANVVRQWGEGNPEARTIFENDSLPLQQFPIWEKICETRSTFIIPDTSLNDRWDSYFGMTWIRSYIGAPLIYNDQVIGIINLVSDQADAFHEDVAKNLKAFAAPAAVAIQNARLYETEQQNRKVAEILSAASVALAQTLDIQMVMETVLNYVQFILPSEVAFVILSEGDERYRIRAVRTSDEQETLRDTLLDQTMDMLSNPIIRSYFTKYETTFIPDSRQVADWNPPLDLGFINCWLGIPLESMGRIFGIVVAGHAIPHSFTRSQIHLLEVVVKQAAVAVQNAWLFEQVRSGRERLQQLSRHLVEIQENERKYIARELHDETSQSLTSLKIGLQIIEQKAAGHQVLLDQVSNLKSLADESLESLHRLAVNLRPASLDHLGLVDALTGLIESTRQRSGINAHFKIMGSVPAALVTEEMETSVYRIVQESLTNVIRHAQAAHVDIILEWQPEKIVIIIEDDGVGMDLQKAQESGRLGLIGMQERAEMLGGKLLVDSAPQVGTTLVVEIPYVHSNTIS